MARHPSNPPPQPPVLSPDLLRRRIDGFRRCIQELQDFDPQQVQKRYGVPEIEGIEASIKDALATAFGHGTPRYNLFKDAANLDQGPHVMRVAPAFGRGPSIDYDARDAFEARKYLAERKNRSTQLLQRAIRSLEDDLADSELSGQPPLGSEFPVKQVALSHKVFIVHGHDGAPKAEVARFIEKLGFEAIILHERPNKGRTLITKFREEADGVGFAIVLMTPDDLGKAASAVDLNLRARQNVVFELGFFIGKLGPEHVVALVKGDDIEKPSDFDGVVYISLNASDWQSQLGWELQAAGYVIDWNKVMRR